MTQKYSTHTLESMGQAVWYNRWTLNKFSFFLSGKILEVGCGIGNFTEALLKYGEVFAIDINQDYVKQTSKIVGKKAKVGFGDIEKGKYFFKDKKFDTVVCLSVLEHIEADKKALKNLFELLEKGGYLILLVPAHDFLFGEIDKFIGHFRRYNKKKLKELISQTGFKIIKRRTINFVGAIGWWISSKLLSRNQVDERKIKIFNLIAPLTLSMEDIIEPPIGTSILIIAKKE